MKVGFLGAGRMATALAKGLINRSVCGPGQITAYDVSEDQRRAFSESTGAWVVDNNAEVARRADVLIVAVKPAHVAEVLKDVSTAYSKQLIISIAAGVPLLKLEEGLPAKARVIRVMPNTPALLGRGAAAFSRGTHATAADGETAKKILEAVGLCFEVPEKNLDAVTGLSGSGPAYFYLVIGAMADAGAQLGIDPYVALMLAAQTAKGAADMILHTDDTPAQLIEMVSSPGGTTVAGMKVLNEKGLPGIIAEAVKTATQRSEELGRG